MIDIVLISIIALGFALYIVAIISALQKAKKCKETLRRKRLEERYKIAKENGYL